jgi:thymidylate synthase
MEFHFNNVNHAFHGMVEFFESAIHTDPEGHHVQEEQSRNGSVWTITEPVLITYHHPLNRVLLNSARDANPFFHLFEVAWMLAGSNDLEPLTHFLPKYADFSDDGKTVHGAYGHRWRTALGFDQLDAICAELTKNPGSRRCILQMWDSAQHIMIAPFMTEPRYHGSRDLEKACNGGKDVPCNTQILFRIVDGKLDMTVTNRSNDLIWGCLGANYVHFSYLLEYMAQRIGVGVGRYFQFSTNLHVYEWNWKPEKWLDVPYEDGEASDVRLLPWGTNIPRFDEECQDVAKIPDGCEELHWESPWIDQVLVPAVQAFNTHKQGSTVAALSTVELIRDSPWRRACREWLQRRVK